eukprot:snap_masked-scaffold_40-processed-gene-0.51-mRNA-1 protein AED:1.00 eAED:1.00 QI:0/-1/0/0/-1/1/1/0/266
MKLVYSYEKNDFIWNYRLQDSSSRYNLVSLNKDLRDALNSAEDTCWFNFQVDLVRNTKKEVLNEFYSIIEGLLSYDKCETGITLEIVSFCPQRNLSKLLPKKLPFNFGMASRPKKAISALRTIQFSRVSSLDLSWLEKYDFESIFAIRGMRNLANLNLRCYSENIPFETFVNILNFCLLEDRMKNLRTVDIDVKYLSVRQSLKYSQALKNALCKTESAQLEKVSVTPLSDISKNNNKSLLCRGLKIRRSHENPEKVSVTKFNLIKF